ncbi:hypothetical protein M408DRAFT_30100 [Serendipita vermifera MAFF 305830]|uniref:Uncharacterized protein n=1 Tax=Serendipita vermifera MAFF 305830 TaxID=933852 RepID=A0A0C2WTC1_SERVB|nr:hypothetical protein M408DRAFT_30100 [Serendipita vermifera MAFF 305830]
MAYYVDHRILSNSGQDTCQVYAQLHDRKQFRALYPSIHGSRYAPYLAIAYRSVTNSLFSLPYIPLNDACGGNLAAYNLKSAWWDPICTTCTSSRLIAFAFYGRQPPSFVGFRDLTSAESLIVTIPNAFTSLPTVLVHQHDETLPTPPPSAGLFGNLHRYDYPLAPSPPSFYPLMRRKLYRNLSAANQT